MRGYQGVEGLSKKEKGLRDMDNSVVFAGAEEVGIKELNGNGKNAVNNFKKEHLSYKDFIM